MLVSKFRGCMLGALLGDCLGATFEGDARVSKRVLCKYFDNLLSGESNKKFSYTDDTAMTLCIAASLIEMKKVDVADIAMRFTNEFFEQPNRGYGHHVMDIFKALKETEFCDVFQPAKLQFDGSGSYGNGAPMRIAPLALFAHDADDNYVIKSAKDISLITHAHQHGYNGGILQCLAVHAALRLDATQHLDPVSFIDSLLKKMEALETKTDGKLSDMTPYCESLNKIKEIYLLKQEDISSEVVAEYLGNSIAAHRSVPTAIYSFLRGLKPLADFECSNPFIRTLYFAISVGGDTDTIATMAGSIAGAYYGADVIPEVLQKQCEFAKEVIEMADDLHDVCTKKDSH
ncbi:ADP-ribosylhydrolase ARH3-like [Uloborus diversus]|uniref:ADP-ribosylhydrolase ARH3-like n=1 Tax=Uloborus diversus TaxID=327109 RepID=UPI002409BBF3|nr:ADP-ribosylhydrolase ARH3-like [Uloborus diversus]